MRYPFVPFPMRGPLRWPQGKATGAHRHVNLEYWDLLKELPAPYYAGGPAILPDMLPGNIPDFPNFSWREYGQRMGVWRLYDAFVEAGVRASCTLNAKTALERRAVIDGALERGFELIPHNYEQGELLCHLQHKPDEERSVSSRRRSRFTSASPAANHRVGYRRHCAALPIPQRSSSRHGLKFWCDLMNDDQPYMIETAKGPIVGVPYSIEINDFTLSAAAWPDQRSGP